MAYGTNNESESIGEQGPLERRRRKETFGLDPKTAVQSIFRNL